MNYQSSKETRKLIVQMLKEYPLNCKKYEKLKKDNYVQEWKMDYMTRQAAGGLKSAGTMARISPTKAFQRKYASIEEALLLEKENVIDRIYELSIQIQIVKLLLLSLREDFMQLVELRYFQKKTVKTICEELYCSRSSFYRKNAKLLDYLAVEYEQLFLKSKNWKKDDSIKGK